MAYTEWSIERRAAGLTAPYHEYRAELKAAQKQKTDAKKAVKRLVPKYKSEEVFIKALLHRAKKKAEKMRWSYDLDLEWLNAKLDGGVCEVTGIHFGLGVSKSPWLPSIDRIDSSKGYTKDNCQLVVWIYNRAKSDGHHREVMLLAQGLLA